MDEIVSSSPPPSPPPHTAPTTGAPSVGSVRNHRGTSSSSSAISRMKKECLSFNVSLQEGFRYVKAFLLGQAKKIRARNEREATEADLQTAKMQADATTAAEDAKKRIHDKSA